MYLKIHKPSPLTTRRISPPKTLSAHTNQRYHYTMARKQKEKSQAGKASYPRQGQHLAQQSLPSGSSQSDDRTTSIVGGDIAPSPSPSSPALKAAVLRALDAGTLKLIGELVSGHPGSSRNYHSIMCPSDDDVTPQSPVFTTGSDMPPAADDGTPIFSGKPVLGHAGSSQIDDPTMSILTSYAATSQPV